MAEGRLPKIALKWMPKQKRARGRPKKNWMKGIKEAMNERNLNEGQWEDRKQWSVGVWQHRKTFWNLYIYIYIFGIYVYIIHLPYIIRTSWLIKVRHSETIPCLVSDLHESYLSVVLAVPTVAALYDHLNATLDAAHFYTFLSFLLLMWFWRQHRGHSLYTWYRSLNLTLNCTIPKNQDNSEFPCSCFSPGNHT